MHVFRPALTIVLAFSWVAFALQAHAQTAGSKPGTVFRDCSDCPEMVVIPAGSAVIGSGPEETARENMPDTASSRERPQHKVMIARPFAVGRFKVTKGQYASFVKETGRTDAAGCSIWDFAAGRWNQDPEKSWRDPGFSQGDNEPAVCVSWADAKDFVAWLSRKTGRSYRLLAEAEWEYAARAGTATARYWGDGRDQACTYANVFDFPAAQRLASEEARKNPDKYFSCDDGHIFTAPVGNFRPNQFGLYDVIGNAWEWVEDCFHDTYDGAPSDGSAWTVGECKYRVQRGGGWGNPPGYSRSARRDRVAPDLHAHTMGLRVSRTLE